MTTYSKQIKPLNLGFKKKYPNACENGASDTVKEQIFYQFKSNLAKHHHTTRDLFYLF